MRRRREPSPESEARRRRTVAAIDRGRLPPDLVARVARGGPATSALSAAEAAALRSLGGEPVALVSGACVIRRLHQPMPSPAPRRSGPAGYVRELTVRSSALNHARGVAVRRLREEAELAGANAVIGIRLRRAEHTVRDDQLNVVESVATGTAVRLPGGDALRLTTLSGTELAALGAAGWHGLDLVAASTVCYVVAGSATIDRFGLTWAQGGTNSEYADYTRGVYAARSKAIGRVEAAAKVGGATGLVGLTWEQEIRPVSREGFGVRDLEVTLHVSGTAIAGSDVQTAHTTAVSVA